MSVAELLDAGVGTGAGEGASRQDTGAAWVTRSADCPEAPAQAHPRPLDAWLTSRPDRCPRCGWHVATQGHAASCTDDGEWRLFVAAVRQAVRDDLTVHQCDMRPLLRGRMEPKHIGLAWRRARRTGLLREVGHERSDDTEGRNAGRMEPYYRLATASP